MVGRVNRHSLKNLNVLLCSSAILSPVTGHFVYGTLRLLDSSPIVWSFCLLDISPTSHFAYETFHLLDSSPPRHFAYCLDSSPTDCPFCLQNCRNKIRSL